MNEFTTELTSRGDLSYRDIVVDGLPLREHFVGRLGAHPALVSPLAWSSAPREFRSQVVSEFLAERKSDLESGLVPVLVCDHCGDVGCGAFVVRILVEGNNVIWADWQHENGYESSSELTWPTRPGRFVFDLEAYRKEVGACL